MTGILTTSGQENLHELVLLRLPELLTVEARSGHDCVWCLTPLNTTSTIDVVLMPGAARYRSCSGCYVARLAWAITWRDWYHHTQDCLTCQHGTVCMVARGRRAQTARVTVQLGEDLRCTAACRQPITRAEPALPIVWEGMTACYPGYIHTHCLPHPTTWNGWWPV
ncbi:hypothetical protein [Streptomyces sp. NPDC088847]|uniref:hypothetical protein n=1 Tax=Streptomyces sp. NPDC088847 TaxID=3365909 RepID=UPI0038216274